MDEAKSNHLAHENSPYLLMHAHNPVDWYPWCEEAFEIALREDRPIFLSIGYSTCHWCHVMSHESFEDPEVADMMNRVFVSIKVDREERSDIDLTYMNVCQLMTGRGGWPLTIIMTPDKRPFFASTYLPKRGRFGTMGMIELIAAIEDLWDNRREELLQTADSIKNAVSSTKNTGDGVEIGIDVIHSAYQGLASRFDYLNGGFGNAPKFPSPQNMIFLLRHWARTRDRFCLEMVETTLKAMRCGGIYDHLGYGFHRYSTDAEWKLPHFEKMLYDQAMISLAYIEAYQATANEFYSSVAKEIFRYVLNEMRCDDGAFYTAQDADSNGIEGAYYTWSYDEILQVLGSNAKLFMKAYSIDSEGNIKDESSGRETGRNVLYRSVSLQDLASSSGMSVDDLRSVLKGCEAQLLKARKGRVPPFRDEKILTDCNGLMIVALSRGMVAFGDKRYGDAALKAANYILSVMREDGRLFHTIRKSSGVFATIDDYAFFIWGLIELYQATFKDGLLASARVLMDEMIDHFWDDHDGGFFFTPDYGEHLLVRQKVAFDGAIPSGNSIAFLDLISLFRLLGDVSFDELASRLSRSFSKDISKAPEAYAMFLTALDFAIGPSLDISIVGSPDAGDTVSLLDALKGIYFPRKTVVLLDDDLSIKSRGLNRIPNQAAAYVCYGSSCLSPVTSAEKLLELLSRFAMNSNH